MFSLRRPSPHHLDQLVEQQEASGRLSYAHVAATRTALPAGYRHDRWAVDLGPDTEDRFQRAARALRHWQPQLGAGFTVVPDQPVTDGMTFVLVVRLGPLFVTAAGRVVYV